MEALLVHSKMYPEEYTVTTGQALPALYLQLYIDHKPLPAAMQLQHTITYISGSCGMFIYYSAKDDTFTYIHTYIHGAHSGSPQLLVNILTHPYSSTFSIFIISCQS